MPRLRDAVITLAALPSTTCGGGPTTSPTATAAAIDLTGTWDESTGGALTWQLTQTGSAVSGPSQFSQDNGRFLGSVSGQGSVSGSVVDGAFTFADSYATLSRLTCSLVVSGRLTVNGPDDRPMPGGRLLQRRPRWAPSPAASSQSPKPSP
jgi:hypothetical protein